jgi:hypothetical protein
MSGHCHPTTWTQQRPGRGWAGQLPAAPAAAGGSLPHRQGFQACFQAQTRTTPAASKVVRRVWAWPMAPSRQAECRSSAMQPQDKLVCRPCTSPVTQHPSHAHPPYFEGMPPAWAPPWHCCCPVLHVRPWWRAACGGPDPPTCSRRVCFAWANCVYDLHAACSALPPPWQGGPPLPGCTAQVVH